MWPLPSPVTRRSIQPSSVSRQGEKWTLLGDHHLLDHPSHRPEGGDGFTAETAETAEQHAQETTKSASGSSPPDPPDPPSWLWPHLRGLCDLCGEPRVSISTVSGGKMVSVRFLPGKVHGHQLRPRPDPGGWCPPGVTGPRRPRCPRRDLRGPVNRRA